MEQHINTFSKGMTSDVNVLFQPDGTYRFAKNCSLIAQDGNNFTIKDCLGNVQVFKINTPYAGIDPGPPVDITFQALPIVIGFISFPNKLIVFSTNAEGIDSDENPIPGYGEIGEIEYTNYGQGIQPTQRFGAANQGYRPLYHHIGLNFTKLKQIEGFAYDENDLLQKVYWTDNFNEPRVFNVSDPIFKDYVSVGSLVPGEQYMVLEGIIEDSSIPGAYFGPGLPNPITPGQPGNIFTATAGPYTDVTTPSPNALIIKYYPLELLDFTPSRDLSLAKFKEYGSGNVLCGSKVYFTRLYSTSGNIATVWSYGTTPIHVGTSNSVPPVPSNFYFDFVGGGSSTATLNSGNSVVLTVENIDTNFDRIQVACAEYDQLTDIPRQITIVADEIITGPTMDIEHTGNNNLSALTLNDITLFPASVLRCKTMTTNKNYILVGNIEEREELDIEFPTTTFTEIERKFPVHTTDIQDCSSVLSYPSVMTQADLTANPTSDLIEYTTWVVTDVSGGDITYNATTYTLGEVITVLPGVPAVPAAMIPAGSQIRPCVAKQKYVTSGGDIVWDYIRLTTGFWSFKDPAVAHHARGYWSGETYRFAFVAFDMKGVPFFAQWLTDFQFENLRTSEISETPSPPNEHYCLKSKAVRINGLRIPKDIAERIKGFSIMRADRDQNIVTQGLLWQTGRSGTAYTPSPYPDPVTNFFGSNSDPYYTLICPDRMVDNTMPNYLFAKKIEEAAWLKAVDFNGGAIGTNPAYGKAIDVDEQYESRFIEQLADVAGDNEQEILTIRDVIEDQAVTNFGTGSVTYTNRSRFSALINPIKGLVNTDCPDGAPGAWNTTQLPDHEATCGIRSVVELKGGMDYYGGATSYGDLTSAGPAGPHKMLVNLTLDKSVFYGGQSAAAKANTLYISTGHFQPITAQVIADTCDTGNPNSYNYLEFNGIDIFGGDCYTCLVDYGHSLFNSTFLSGGFPISYSMGIKFPCQCNANYDLRRGRTVSNNRMHAVPAGVVYRSFPLNEVRLEEFSYNKGYSSEGTQFAYPALPVAPFLEQQFKTRIRFAGVKIINEFIDSFRNFLINDFKDLSGTYGEINNLKTKDERTFVWQNNAIATVPVLERQIVGSETGQPTILGTGGVVDRYDIISSYYGNQHQWSLIPTEYGFAWFDMRRKAVMMFDSGLSEISAIEGLKAFFDEVFLEVRGNTAPSSNLLNDPLSAITQDRPLVGNGITGVYDPKFKFTYLTFKFKKRAFVSGENYTYLTKDFTIGFYHPGKIFVSFFDWAPAIAHNHHQSVLSCNNPSSKSKYYGPTMPPTTFGIGDTAGLNNTEYVCIAPVTISSYPGLLSVRPGTDGGLYWYKINATDEIWVHNQPKALGQSPAPDYEYSKFFGLVVDSELHVVVNPKVQNAFNVLNMEQVGNNENVTDVYTYAEGQSASDTNITSYSRFYKRIYDKITSSLPLQSNGSRITDNYLLIVLKKKNWSLLPYDRSRNPKILQMIKTFFQQKR